MKAKLFIGAGVALLVAGAWWWLANGARDQSGRGRAEVSLPRGGAGLVDGAGVSDRERIAELKKDLLVPVDGASELTEAQIAGQTRAIRELAMMQNPQASEALVSLLFAPKEVYFTGGLTENGVPWQSYSHHVMFFLSKTVEGAPVPKNKAYCTTEDIDAFRSWWRGLEGRIPYKAMGADPK
ncbi:hypothetical protein [Verrucomicrobium sp. BvORR106]|uniref:hypothetical protein n=1 Tax=Verrucomicrobium sp. BvORR106 TaxID=1403819 RepID=UPI00056F306E|nr:hypothetical protein [Verrucomicrobium sp. BvORR106]